MTGRARLAWVPVSSLLFSTVSAFLPPASAPTAPRIAAASGENITSPRFVSAAVMPNGQVGLLFQNNGAEIRFKKYTTEQSTAPSIQLSSATPAYPQLVTFRGELVAAYVDTRAPNAGKLTMRISTDNGATWSAESYPLGAATFGADTGFAPTVVTSRDAQTLYVFSATNGAIPQYRTTTDTSLTVWSAVAPAGNSSMRVTSSNNCGNAGAECYRAHGYQFMETATAGRWIYITKSDSGYGQSGRGTQYGTLGGAWSVQVDLGGSGGLSGGGEGTATTFLDRSGAVYYLRSSEFGDEVYLQKSIDAGASWGPRIYAYNPGLATYAVGAPVGLYVPTYSQGEYVWWAGFGGSEDTVRVDGLWTAAAAYPDTGTARLFGSAGGDWDAGLEWTYTFGAAKDGASAGTGVFTTQATDLALPGRLLPFAFTRTYNSADVTPGPLGRGWTHSYNWKLIENGNRVTLRRGDGRVDTFTRNPDGTFANLPGVFDVLVKNPDGSFTLTTPSQVQFEFGASGLLTRIHEPAGNQITLGYSGADLTTITDTVGRPVSLSYDASHHLLALQDPSGRKVSYVYDEAGRLSGVWDKRANSIASPYPATVQADAPAGYWKFDETGTSTVVADQRNVQAGTTYGGVTRGVGGIANSPSSKFDGSSGYVSVPSNAAFNFGTGDFTIEAWANRSASGSNTYPVILSKRPWSVASEPGWSISNLTADPTKLALHLANKDLGDAGMQTATGVLIPNVWHHIALVYTALDRIGRLYVDGAIVLTTPATDGTTGASSTAAITMGRNNAGTGDYYGGRLDEVAIYPSALSAARVLAHYQANLKPSWQYGYEPTSQHLTTITDPDGRVALTNTYDSAGRLATQKDGLLKQTIRSYSANQTVITPPRNNASTLTFDSRQRLTSQATYVSGLTRTLSYTYDTAGNRVSATDRDGNRTDFSYDARGNLLTRTAPQVGAAPRAVTTMTYDTKNNVLTVTDPRSFVTTNTYNAATNALTSTTSQIDATTSAVAKFEYADALNPGLPTRIISPRGNTTPTPNYTYSQLLAYDSAGNLTQRIDADAAKTTYGYDSLGRRTSTIDPDGNAPGGVPSQHTWSTAYDANDQVTSETNPLAKSASYTYDATGNQLTVTNKNGNVSTYAYDAASRLSQVTQKPDPVGQPTVAYTTTLTRDDSGNPIKVTQANGVLTDYTYDELDRQLTTLTHPTPTTSLTTSYILNGNGQPTTKTTGDGVGITYAYDAMTRLSSVAAAGLTTIAYGYDLRSQRTTMTDGTGSSSYQYDGLGRLTQAVPPNGTTTYGYDLDSNRTTLGYPIVGTVSYAYSPGGRLTSLTDWAARASTYTYTASGRAKTVNVPGGMTTSYGYDNAQRLLSLSNMVGAATISSHSYTLDNEGNRTALDEAVPALAAGAPARVTGASLSANASLPPTVWNAGSFVAPVLANDKLIAVVVSSTDGPAVSTSGITDSLGNAWSRDVTPVTWLDSVLGGELSIWSTVSVAGTPTNITATFASAVGSAGLSVVAYRGLSTAPGAAGVDLALLVSGTGSGINGADSGTTTATTTAANELKLGIYADQGTVSQPLDAGTLDTVYALVIKDELNTNGQTLIEDASSGPAGSTARATATLDTTPLPYGMGVVVYKSAPAGTDRFTYSYDGLERLTAGTTTNPESFTLDAASNIASRTGPTATYSYDTANRLTGDGTQAFTWNAADRLTNRGPDTFGYDPLDRLTSSTVSATARSYAYNGDGLLQSRLEGVTTTPFLWDPSSSPSRLLQQGSDKIVYGLGPLYVVKADGTTSSFARDGGKSVRAEVNGTGTVTASFRYRAYGAISQFSGSSAPTYLGYAGQLQDPSGLLYMRARWYDPAVGRFTTHDPVPGDPSSPRALNAYGYANANPSILVDPSGLAATVGDDGGACVDEACDFHKDYSTTTVGSAAENRMTWYLETAAAKKAAAPDGANAPNPPNARTVPIDSSTRPSSSPIHAIRCGTGAIGALTVFEASTFLGLAALVLQGVSISAIPVTAGISTPASLAAVATGFMLEGTAIAGYLGGTMLLINACQSGATD